MWWNERLLLPRDLVIRDAGGEIPITIARVRHEVDGMRLKRPEARFPGYRAMDLADSLKGH